MAAGLSTATPTSAAIAAAGATAALEGIGLTLDGLGQLGTAATAAAGTGFHEPSQADSRGAMNNGSTAGPLPLDWEESSIEFDNLLPRALESAVP